MQDTPSSMPDAATLKAANVNPVTGLATDYLNVFNEYIMLAELVADGSMDAEVLREWQPIDYESHFVQSGFVGAKTVLAAYRAMGEAAHAAFEAEVNSLIDLILAHQSNIDAAPKMLADMQAQRDAVAALISGPEQGTETTGEDTQAAIDALFD